MILKIIEELVELTLIITSLYLVLSVYVHHYQPAWSEPFYKRRFTMLLVLILAVTAVKVTEDVIGGESGLIDSAILLYIHNHVPNSLIWLFEAITITGSSRVLFPLATLVTITLMYKKYRLEALIVATSAISSAFAIYVIKMIVSRNRPNLWDTVWSWGASFPSGHTLAVTAFATAAVLCVGKNKPKYRNLALLLAIIWISLVAASRLVLGVHWPTDVLVSICLGALLPLAISAAFKYLKLKCS